MEIFLAFIIPFAITALSYISYCAAVFLYEEIVAEIKNAKQSIRQSIWDLEWQWKLFKMGVEQWLTK